MKRGNVGIVLIVVLVVAVIGTLFLVKELRSPSGQVANFGPKYYADPPEYKVPTYYYETTSHKQSEYYQCEESCYARYGPVQAQQCALDCAEEAHTPVYRSTTPTGNFAMPEPKAYGGAVRGIIEPEAKAFRGRAVEGGDQSCFTCSCLDQGITAQDEAAAQKVCEENCGGTITNAIAGACR